VTMSTPLRDNSSVVALSEAVVIPVAQPVCLDRVSFIFL
jgi:hypothetical protein